MTVKRTLKRTAGQASAVLAPLHRSNAGRAVCILAYHRIARIDFVDPVRDNWNVPPAVFERQVQALSESCEILALSDVPARLASRPRAARPLVCLTFDDGFATVCTEALPILRRFEAPATCFVVTKYIGSGRPMPFDRWSQHNERRVSADAWRPMTWHEIDHAVASGLVTFGAHSHEHLDGRSCTAAQLDEEAGESKRILERRLGPEHAASYAYPYGSTRLGEVSAAYVEAVQRAGYQRAVSTDLGLVTAVSDVFLLPRVEITAQDTPAVVRAKALGSLLPLRWTDRLRRARRSA